MKNNSKIKLTLLLVLVFMSMSIFAQCPMCKMAAETNLQNGGTEGKGLNAGILYLLAMPYLLVCVIGYVWWRKRKHLRSSSN
jgi:hypothetical protein